MRLSDRLKSASDPDDRSSEPARLVVGPDGPNQAQDPFAEIKQRAQETLYRRLGARLTDPSIDEAELRTILTGELSLAIDQETVPLSPEERLKLVREITQDVVGYGPITSYLADPNVTEVMVLSDKYIYVEVGGRIQMTPHRYVSEAHLRHVIERIVSAVGRRIDESSPTVDARLADGSRVHAIIPPLAVDGPLLTIRKFSQTAFTPADLVAFGTLSEELVEFASRCVEGRLNILISGGTGSGKTTLLNCLSGFIPEQERIVTIEDAVELRLNQRHVARLEARPANIEGKGEVTIRDLVRTSLRMRPDRIVVGEARSGEALDMLQAMNTGHEGSMSTVHANSPRHALSRLETMVLMAGFDLPVKAIREQIVGALDVIVHLGRLRDGTRRVTQVVEVEGLEGDVITLNSLFEFDFAAGLDERGLYRGSCQPTGVRPKFADKLAMAGVALPVETFGDPTSGLMTRRGRS